MAAQLSNIEEALERTIFHALRKKTVEFEYSPDIMLFDIENLDDTIAESEQQRFLLALEVIKNNKGFAIEIFNYTNNQYYGAKKPARIVVETESFQVGQLGTDITIKYNRNLDGTYSTSRSTSMLSDFYFNIHLIGN